MTTFANLTAIFPKVTVLPAAPQDLTPTAVLETIVGLALVTGLVLIGVGLQAMH